MNAALDREPDIAALWRRQALLRGDDPALIFGAQVVTFSELDRWSDALALAARDAGVQPGHVVAILAERSPEAIAGMLAAAKCGVAYLPLEPNLPVAWRRGILAEVQPQAILASGEAANVALGVDTRAGASVIDLRSRGSTSSDRSAASLEWPVCSRDTPFYLLYTSGSSGAPKGVLGTQRGLLNRLEWSWATFPFAAGERAAHRTPLGFVDSVAEIWGALLHGVPLVVIAPAAVADLDEFVRVIGADDVTRVVIVPSLLNAVLAMKRPLASEWSALRYCVTSGEPLPADLAAEFRRQLPDCRLLNFYGMTEAAADVTWYEVSAAVPTSAVPIGSPIAGIRVELLDESSCEIARGERGQVHVGGCGVALGYYRRPRLTARSFVPDPSPEFPGARLYATGDYARYNAAGELEFLGRVDHQVKIRGHRIDLMEIERYAKEHPAANECVAVVSDVSPENLQLFVSVRPLTDVTAAEMRTFLAQRLPGYMVPAFVHVREQLPKLSNGKVDRRALVRSVGVPSSAGERPATEAEVKVALIWQELLRTDMPARSSSFLELGGNSLTAALAVTRLRAAFGVDLSVTEFLDGADLAGVAQGLQQRATLARLRAAPADSLDEAIDF